MEIQHPKLAKMNANEIYELLKQKLQFYQDKGKLDAIEKVQFDDSSLCAFAKGVGFEVDIVCVDGHIKTDLKLSLLLKPMRKKIEQMVDHFVAKALGSED